MLRHQILVWAWSPKLDLDLIVVSSLKLIVPSLLLPINLQDALSATSWTLRSISKSSLGPKLL